MSAVESDNAYDPLTPVPDAQRPFGGRDAFALWFSLGIGLLVMQSGAGLAPGLGFLPAIGAIVLGSVLGVLMLGAAGVVGVDTGVSAMAGLRPVLGRRGAAIPAVLNALQLVGWGVFELIAMSTTADALCQQAFGFSANPGWTIFFGALATGMALAGPVSLVRRFLRRYGVWLLLAGAAWLSWRLISNPELPNLLTHRGDGSMSFAHGMDLVVAMPISWLPLVADYTRFGRSPRAMFRGSASGYLVANVWFFALGLGYALLNGSDSLLFSTLAISGGGLAVLLIVIDETDNAFADIFSAASSTALLTRGSVPRLAIGYGVLCTALAVMVPLTAFETFLYLISAVFAPLFAVLFVDHFVIRRRRMVMSEVTGLGSTAGFSVRGLTAWAIGIGIYELIANLAPEVGATLPAMAASALAHWGMWAAARRLAKTSA